MALTESKPLHAGSPCPDFDLPAVDGGRFRRADFDGQGALVVMFLCNHCPYVQAVEDRVIALAREFADRGVGFAGICSNDAAAYPEDAPAKLLERWRAKAYGFPYLIDESQEVARRFDAVSTPEFYVFGADRRLAYHGQLDDNWKEPGRVRQRDLALAIEAVLAGRAPAAPQRASIGCSMKWKARGAAR